MGNRTDPLHELLVLLAPPALVRFPDQAPLLLESPPVRVKKLPVIPGRHQLAERRLAEVVDEHILSAHHPVPRRADAHGKVVVFEHAYFIALVERPDAIVDVAAHGRTEHGHPPPPPPPPPPP